MAESTRQQLDEGLVDRLEEAFLDIVQHAGQSEVLQGELCELLVPMLAIVVSLRVPGPTDWSSEDVRHAADRAAAQLSEAIARLPPGGVQRDKGFQSVG